MIELSMVRDLVTIFGVIAGFTYYVLTVRNAQKARQTQMFMPIYSRVLDSEYRRHFSDIRVWEWKDYDDWEEKYYRDRDEWAKLVNVMTVLGWVWVLLKRKQIDLDVVNDTMRLSTFRLWEGIEPIVKEFRERWDFPEFGLGVEYLYKELKNR